MRFRFLSAVPLTSLLMILLATPTAAVSRHARPGKPAPVKAGWHAGPAELKEARTRLAWMHYWITSNPDSLRQAIIAFQKLENRKPTGKLSQEDLAALREARRPVPREKQVLAPGKIRIEVDLDRQVMFIIDSRNLVAHILPVSTGSGREFESEGFVRDAVTPPGRFNIFLKIKGWKESPIGLLYFPSYFLAGLAIHGSPYVPAHRDSHGCVRIPMFAALDFFAMAKTGTEVLVYGSMMPVDAAQGR